MSTTSWAGQVNIFTWPELSKILRIAWIGVSFTSPGQK